MQLACVQLALLVLHWVVTLQPWQSQCAHLQHLPNNLRLWLQLVLGPTK
jgi:hypothetical protein